MRKSILHIVLVCLAAVLLSSCTTIRRFVPEGSYLLNKNKVVIKNGPVDFKKSDVSGYIQQKPVRTQFPFRLPLWFYYITEHKQSGFAKWINHHLGKQPEYYDPNATANSARQIEQYLNNRGYFHSKVTTQAKRVSRMRRHLIRATYTIQATEPYRIRKINYDIEDTVLAPHLMRLEPRFPAQVGQIYNSYTLDEQRTFITEYMRNAGYYFFTKESITYEVDSSFNDHTLEITMKVADAVDRESGKPHPHRRYTINRINIYPNHSPILGSLPPIDSTSLSLTTGYRDIPNTLHFYYHEKPRIRPSTFSQMIQVIEGQPYRLRQVSQTYSALSNLRIIGNTSIEFDTVPNHDSLYLLNCNIYMRQAEQRAFKVQTEGTNTGGDLGISGSVTYTNKNIFHGAEVLQVSVKGGLESQNIAELDDLDEGRHLFNTGELIFNSSLFIPKFLSPIPLKTFAWDYQPRTTFSLGSSMQVRYAYSRYITMGSFGYDWKANPRLQFILTPIYLNSVKVNPSPEFQALLDQESNQRLKDQYTNHLILGGKYTFIYNTQNSFTKPRHYVYLRGSIESSGGLLSLFNNTKLVSQNDDHHELLGIRYAQFLRADIDFRQYWRMGESSLLVFRQFVGVGVPYGNSYDMPFERSFYAGGSTGMRGWTYRRLGPGAYVPSQSTPNIERIGDIQLECNAEFRFPIYGSVNGAVFADLGNIWNYHDNDLLPGGAFHFNTFYQQLALDAGIGARFDFKVAIIRLDLAMPLRYPYPDSQGNHWNLKSMGILDLHPVLNIGYPF